MLCDEFLECPMDGFGYVEKIRIVRLNWSKRMLCSGNDNFITMPRSRNLANSFLGRISRGRTFMSCRRDRLMLFKVSPIEINYANVRDDSNYEIDRFSHLRSIFPVDVLPC